MTSFKTNYWMGGFCTHQHGPCQKIIEKDTIRHEIVSFCKMFCNTYDIALLQNVSKRFKYGHLSDQELKLMVGLLTGIL